MQSSDITPSPITFPPKVGFRKDINGLRAWAVMAVVLFHAGITQLQGGFIGVDIFFVLSGYLMTGIIISGLEKQSFSYGRFVLARAGRIFPPLIALVLILLILGWFFLANESYEALGKNGVYALRFWINLRLARGMGYFDPSQDENWLLHTWSLSVEWQFYMLLPLLLMVLWKIKPRLRLACIGLGLVTLGSLIASTVMVSSEPTKAYFLLTSRAWEMAGGGLVFFASRYTSVHRLLSQRAVFIGQWLAWAVLLGSLFVFSDAWGWPGLWALIPVTATMIILLAHNDQNPLIANPIAQWLGNRSYSIYLWHWPVIVALKFAMVPLTPVTMAAAFAVILILGDLSWRLLEIRLRRSVQTLKLRPQSFAVFGALVLAYGLATAVRKIPIEGRLPEAAEHAAFAKINTNPRRNECLSRSFEKRKELCTYGDTKYLLGAIVIGDSHSDSIVNGAMLSAEKYQKNLGYMGLSGCGTIDDIRLHSAPERFQMECQQFNNWALTELEQYDTNIPVIVINRTSAYIGEYSSAEAFSQAMVGMACRLAAKRPVYLIRPVPEHSVNIPDILYRKFLFQGQAEDITQPIAGYYPAHKIAWDAQDRAARECGVKILDPLPFLCKNDVCLGSKNGQALYYDGNHMNEFGNRFLIPMFDPVFDQKS